MSAARLTVSSPPVRPLLVWDGDCRFCARWVRRLERRVGPAFDTASYQEVATRFPEVGEEAFTKAVHLIEPDGRVTRGAEAVFCALKDVRGWSLGWRCYQRCGLFRCVSEALYRWVARNRGWLSKVTP
ncbi:MAG: DCC1-like thiol-disulfide oxidoreductase family protein [Verrucomicrobiota bacterium JB024]|nr:DCC1-like thiol-disulfide oxidoreductase family protein [Verrucomicrobiota bacterium JB024]